MWQVHKDSLRFISDRRLLALEVRANQEVDNAAVQAQYLEAVLEVDPDYLVRRVQSGRYAVDDDVRYLYRKALLAVEVSQPHDCQSVLICRLSNVDFTCWICGSERGKNCS